MAGDRTEQASPHRRERARKDGDFPRSRELSSAAGTLAGVLCLGLLGPRMMQDFEAVFVAALNSASANGSSGASLKESVMALRRPIAAAGIPVCLAMTAIVVATALCGMLQSGGLQMNGSSVACRLERVNPLANIKNLFSLRAASRVGKSLIPSAILVIFAFRQVARELTIPPFSLKRIEMLGFDAYGMLAATAWLLLGWALIDYVVEWRSRESRLMMSREEMKQEFKETEGSPQTRSRIRGLQRQMRRRKVKADVAKAAVVLTNPTHYAVALAFDFATMDRQKCLPRVVIYLPRKSRPRRVGPVCRS